MPPWLVGMKRGMVCLEDSLAVSYRTKHTLNPAIQQSQSLAFTRRSGQCVSTQYVTWVLTAAVLGTAEACKPRVSFIG